MFTLNGGLNNGPSKCPGTCDYVTLYGKRDFADVSKGLEMGWLFRIITRVLRRGKQASQQGETERRQWKQRPEGVEQGMEEQGMVGRLQKVEGQGKECP